MSEVDACLELLLTSTVNQLSLVMKAKAIARTYPLSLLVEVSDIRACHANQVELLKELEEYIKEKQAESYNKRKETKP